MKRIGTRWSSLLFIALGLSLVAWSIWQTLGADSDGGTTSDAGAADDVSPPRIVLLVSLDTLRADRLGLYGFEALSSPVLDALGQEGVVFDDASSTAPWTLPAHASMMTGLNPRSHRVTGYESALPVSIPTLAGLLAESGYSTAAVVNAVWLRNDKFGLTRDFHDFSIVKDRPDRRAPSKLVTDQAIEAIRQSDGDPLFLFVHYYDIHADYASLPEFERLMVSPYEGIVDGTGDQLRLADPGDRLVARCRTKHDPELCSFGRGKDALVVDPDSEALHFDEADMKHLEELYVAGIRQLDTELFRLFEALDELGIDDETLLIVTSDHGEEFMEHGRLEHMHTMWQEVLRVPLIMRGPGLPRGLRVSQPVSLIDIAPTVLALTGTPIPPDLEGHDLAPLWRGGDARPFEERLLYGEASGSLEWDEVVPDLFDIYHSVRRGPYKLVYESRGDTYGVYDLRTDPYEQRDIASEVPEVTEVLLAEIRSRLDEAPVEPADEDRVTFDEEELEELRALGYVP